MIGQTIHGYRLEEQIGEGAFGKVYRAVHLDMGRVAAVKVARELRFGQMLVQEGKLLARLSHPNIVGIIHMDARSDPPFVVMEYVDGESLATRLKRGPLTADETIELAMRLLDGLAAAHELSILHRDIKPSNILIAADGTPKLADFGLGRVVAEESLRQSMGPLAAGASMMRSQVSQEASDSGELVGTIAYMSPEQLRGEQIDCRADLYSLGVVLYEALTGELPAGRFALPGELLDGMPGYLDTALDLMLAGRPGSRPNSADAARTLLEAPPASATDSALAVPKAGVTEAVTVSADPVPRPEVAVGNVKPWERPGSHEGEEIVGPDGGAMVWVPAGEFMMGSSDGRENEKPVHRVRITKGFWLGKHTVTNAQYSEFCALTGRTFPGESDQGDDHPVVCVSWQDAVAYCQHYGLSLPTEAEWEYAARGPEGRTYPWGNDWDGDRCCNVGNKGPSGRTYPVSSFPAGASWCGALDLLGNVFEWCADWYDKEYYGLSPVDHPTGPSSGESRVIRGGSWGLTPTGPRSALRIAADQAKESIHLGFRSRYMPEVPERQFDLNHFFDRVLCESRERAREEQSKHIGRLVTGVVRQRQGDDLYMTVTENYMGVLLPKSEQSPRDPYRINDRLKIYLLNVLDTPDPQFTVSRTHPAILTRLLELEVPEIADGDVEIRAVAREPGKLSKVSVVSNNPQVDATAACIGHEGSRIQAVVDELYGERVDIVRYTDDIGDYVRNALWPAKVDMVLTDPTQQAVVAITPNDELAVAMGDEGVNVRLAAQLTGCRIDILSESQYSEIQGK